MKIKNIFLTIATVVSVFALASTAFAITNINVTSEPIRADATCDKAGGFTLTFGTDVSLVGGDQITIDLEYGVTLCRDVDIVIAAAANAQPGSYGPDVGWDTATATVGANSPVFMDDVSGTAQYVGGGIYFYIHGNSGSQRITIDVLGEQLATSSVTVGSGPDDEMTLKFLDQQVNADFTDQVGIWIDPDGDGIYDTAATLADNTICIDVSSPDFSGTTVNANFDSKGDKFTFDPSNPQIAHLAPSVDIDIAYCEKAGVGRVELGSKIAPDQGVVASEDCDDFDFEDLDGYCAESAGLNNKLILESAQPYESVNYELRLEILVNGESGSNGVFWSNEAVMTASDNDLDDLCNLDTAAYTVPSTHTYRDEDGDPATPEAPHSNECDVATGARAVVLIVAADSLGLIASDTYLWIDLPAFNYDIDEVSQDDEVSVEVTLIKAPCGELFTGEVDVANLGCTPPTPPAQTSRLLFPYFTAMDADEDTWWDGIAIINLTSNVGTLTITIYEMDGDVGTATATLPANGMYLTILDDLLAGMAITTTVEGTLGNSPCYGIVNASGTNNIDGFGMAGENTVGWGLAYLPRRSW
jgi:hypothetical protein